MYLHILVMPRVPLASVSYIPAGFDLLDVHNFVLVDLIFDFFLNLQNLNLYNFNLYSYSVFLKVLKASIMVLDRVAMVKKLIQ